MSRFSLLLLIIFTLLTSAKAQDKRFADRLFSELKFKINSNVNELDTQKLTKKFAEPEGWSGALKTYNYSFLYSFTSASPLKVNGILLGINPKGNITNMILLIKNVDEETIENLIGKPSTIADLPNYVEPNSNFKKKLLFWRFSDYCLAYYLNTGENNELIFYNCDFKSVFKIFNRKE